MWNALQGKGEKSAKTLELLGCTGKELLEYLEAKKIPGKDYSGELHVDHIVPCDHFDLSDPNQQKICFHYSNLQYLTAKENLEKSNRT